LESEQIKQIPVIYPTKKYVLKIGAVFVISITSIHIINIIITGIYKLKFYKI
jgi:hypothetical protein